jgi:putative endonuclease
MAYYVYIIESQVDGSYYKGYSENPRLRLIQHNNKESDYTSHKVPWILIYVEENASKTAISPIQ